MPQGKIALLREAIQGLKQVTGSYDTFDREFCPHILGQKDGEWHVLTWQFGGGTSEPEGLPPEGDWRCFRVDGLSNLVLRKGQWHHGWRTGRGEQHCVDDIDTVVDATHAAELRHTLPPRTRPRGPGPPGRRK